MLSKDQVRAVRRDVTREDSRLPAVFQALGDDTRFRIFYLFTQHKDLCVTDVANILGISVPAASQQLRMMEFAGLVKKERMGQMMCYCIREDDPLVKSVIKMIHHS